MIVENCIHAEQLTKSGISIKPAYVFTGDYTTHQDYFRIGYGEKIMPAALSALINFVEEHKQAWVIASG